MFFSMNLFRKCYSNHTDLFLKFDSLTDSFVAFYSSQLKERLLVNKDLKSVYFSHKMIV